MPVLFVFMQDKVIKHLSKLAKDWFYKEHIHFLVWPGQNSDLNSIEYSWNDVNDVYYCSTKVQKFERFVDWNMGCMVLDSQRTLSRRCHAALENRGYLTKYLSNKLKTLIFLLFIKIYRFYSRNINLCYFTV